MNSIASFTIETGGQKDRDAISKQHGDAFHALELPIDRKDAMESIYMQAFCPRFSFGKLGRKAGRISRVMGILCHCDVISAVMTQWNARHSPRELHKSPVTPLCHCIV